MTVQELETVTLREIFNDAYQARHDYVVVPWNEHKIAVSYKNRPRKFDGSLYVWYNGKYNRESI